MSTRTPPSETVAAQLEEALAALHTALDRLEVEIAALPEGEAPGVRRLPGDKAFVVDFSTMAASGIWSAHYYDFRRQYRLVIDELRRGRRELALARLRSVVKAGAIGVGRNSTKLHPEVLARLSALLPHEPPVKEIPEVTVNHNGTACRVLAGQYHNNGRLALRLVEIETGEPWTTATVNLPDESLEFGRLFVKDYSENAGVADALVAAGLVQATGRLVSTGYTQVGEYELNPTVCARLVAMGVLDRPGRPTAEDSMAQAGPAT